VVGCLQERHRWQPRITSLNDGLDDDLDTVTGDVITFMWDYGVQVPLWTDAEGLLPEEPEWLRRVLGLSDPLIADLTAWGRAMFRLDAHPRLRTAAAYRALDAQARRLVDLVGEELPERFTVTYRPG